jgi:hypothetical protein
MDNLVFLFAGLCDIPVCNKSNMGDHPFCIPEDYNKVLYFCKPEDYNKVLYFCIPENSNNVCNSCKLENYCTTRNMLSVHLRAKTRNFPLACRGYNMKYYVGILEDNK